VGGEGKKKEKRANPPSNRVSFGWREGKRKKRTQKKKGKSKLPPQSFPSARKKEKKRRPADSALLAL